MTELGHIDSSRLSTPLHSPLKGSQGKGFDPREIIFLERWQDYVYLGVMFFTVCTIAKRALSGNVSGTLSNSITLVTVVMGKVYTDDALAKYSLGMVAKSMESHIHVLQHQVSQFSDQLEENRGHLALLGHENDIYTKQNAHHQEAVLETRRILSEYAEQLVAHRETVLKLELEISSGNGEKERLTKELEERREELRTINQKVKEASDRLLRQVQLLEQANKRREELDSKI